MKRLFKKKYAHIRFFITYNLILVLFLHNGSFANIGSFIKDFLIIFCCLGFTTAMLHYGLLESLFDNFYSDYDKD